MLNARRRGEHRYANAPAGKLMYGGRDPDGLRGLFGNGRRETASDSLFSPPLLLFHRRLRR